MARSRRDRAAEPAGHQVFTTGEAAAVCRVSQQTIIRSFDAGRLGGFRVPGSRFRRIPRDALLRFMREHEIPTDALEPGRTPLLLVEPDEQQASQWRRAAERDGRFDLTVAANLFEAGRVMEGRSPRALLLGSSVGAGEQGEILSSISSWPPGDPVRLLRVVESARAEAARSGVEEFAAPGGPGEALSRLAEALGR